MTSKMVSKIKDWHLPKNHERLSPDPTAQKNTGLQLTAGKFLKLDIKAIALIFHHGQIGGRGPRKWGQLFQVSHGKFLAHYIF